MTQINKIKRKRKSKIPNKIKKLCKKHKIRLTTKYRKKKSLCVLLKELKTKIKRKRKSKRKRYNKFGEGEKNLSGGINRAKKWIIENPKKTLALAVGVPTAIAASVFAGPFIAAGAAQAAQAVGGAFRAATAAKEAAKEAQAAQDLLKAVKKEPDPNTQIEMVNNVIKQTDKAINQTKIATQLSTSASNNVNNASKFTNNTFQRVTGMIEGVAGQINSGSQQKPEVQKERDALTVLAEKALIAQEKLIEAEANVKTLKDVVAAAAAEKAKAKAEKELEEAAKTKFGKRKKICKNRAMAMEIIRKLYRKSCK